MTSRLCAYALVFGAAFAPSALAQFSSPMRDVENPNRFTVYANCPTTMNPGNATGGCTMGFFSPINKNVVLNTINIRCVTTGAPATRIGNVRIRQGATGTTIAVPPVNDAVALDANTVEQGLMQTGLRLLVLPFDSNNPAGIIVDFSRYNTTGTSACDIVAHGTYLP